MTCGIYLVTHVASGMQYVGLSRNIEKRWRSHLAAAKRGSTLAIHDAIRLHGKEEFSMSTLETCFVGDLNAREIYWIEKLGTFGRGYNRTRGGNHADHTAETLAKLRGRKRSPETRSRISAARAGKPAHNKGRPMTDDQKAKISVARLALDLKGVAKSPEHRAKLVAALAIARARRWVTVG